MSDTLAEVETKLKLVDIIPLESFSPKVQRAGGIIDEMDISAEDKRDIFVYYLFSTSTKKDVKKMAAEFPIISERQFISSIKKVPEDENLEMHWNKFQQELQKQNQQSTNIR